MPSGIANADLIDLTRTTLQHLPDMEFEVALDSQNYPVCNKWFAGDKKVLDSGTSIERNIMLDTSGNARFVRLYQKTPINVADVQLKITAPWTQVQTHWSIERREALRNRAKARYISLVQSRRSDATLDMADLLETKAWTLPSSSADDLNPRGIPYWLSFLPNADTSTGAFSGMTVRYTGGTTSTTKGGIDANVTANAKWKNWAFVRTAIDAAFVKNFRRAFHATRFISPVLAKDLDKGPASDFRIYMSLSDLTDFEDLTTKQNDNLGRDLDPFHGATTFRRVPVIYTPQLDGDTFSPIYAVNHKKFYPMVLDGDWMREDGPHSDVEQHNVQTTFVDCSFQYFCSNVREAGFVSHTVTS
jgi:hypothetical protein